MSVCVLPWLQDKFPLRSKSSLVFNTEVTKVGPAESVSILQLDFGDPGCMYGCPSFARETLNHLMSKVNKHTNTQNIAYAASTQCVSSHHHILSKTATKDDFHDDDWPAHYFFQLINYLFSLQKCKNWNKKCTSQVPRVQGEVIKSLALSNQQPKTRKESVYNDVKQRKVANPQM